MSKDQKSPKDTKRNPIARSLRSSHLQQKIIRDKTKYDRKDHKIDFIERVNEIF